MNRKKVCITASLLVVLLAGCDTLNRDLTASRMNRQYQLQLQEEREQLFRSQVNTALQAAAGRLTLKLYDKLGKGGEAYNTFKVANIKYNYQERTATVDLMVFWDRKAGKEVVITGYLKYYGETNIYFYCTDAEGTRTLDKSYVRKMIEGIYI